MSSSTPVNETTKAKRLVVRNGSLPERELQTGLGPISVRQPRVKVRLGDDRPCLLVLVGSLPDGTKAVVAVYDGERESKLSWMEVLRDLKKRG